MPELPDVTVYIEALRERILTHRLERVSIRGPFLLRSASPPVTSVEGRSVLDVRRLGKRICIGIEDDLWLVLHLMIAGRLKWKPAAPKSPASSDSGRVRFRQRNAAAHRGRLEAPRVAPRRRAARSARATLDRGGIDVLDVDLEAFATRLARENHTLKRALTDPHVFSGIGNAYSDEILHRARLSPVTLTEAADATTMRPAVRRHARRRWRVDATACAPRRAASSRRRSRPSAPRWRSTAVRKTVSRLRHAGAAHPLRRQRDQLLPQLPDRRKTPRRPRALPPAARRLAAHARRAGDFDPKPPLKSYFPPSIGSAGFRLHSCHDPSYIRASYPKYRDTK